MVMTPAGRHCSNRAIEWLMAAMLLGIALAILITPRTLETGAFRYLIALFGIGPWGAFALCLGVGSIRMVGLYYNGTWHPVSARMRSVGAILSAIIWGVMAYGLAYLTVESRTISIGIPVYVCLTVGEIYSSIRAGADAKSPCLGR